jgi:hypothetical protein
VSATISSNDYNREKHGKMEENDATHDTDGDAIGSTKTHQ